MMSKGSDAGGGRESQDGNRRAGGCGRRRAWEDVRVGTETGCREAGRSGHDDDTLSLPRVLRSLLVLTRCPPTVRDREGGTWMGCRGRQGGWDRDGV